MKNQVKPVNESFARHIVWMIQKTLKVFSYLRLPDQDKSRNTVFFIIDPQYLQGGFSDRIKAIVNTYFIAKCNGMDFKLYFHHPFDIEKYYRPNVVDWRCELKDLDKSIFSSKLSCYRPEMTLPKLKKKFQYHYYWYCGADMFYFFQEHPEMGVKRNFDELFVPTEHLLKMAADTGLKEKKYVSVHFRFINLLGNFEGKHYKYPTLKEEDQVKYMKKCFDCLKKISSKHPDMPVYVFSDSEKFLKECEKKGYLRISGGPIGHIAHNESEDVADKTILDFYIISKSAVVYSVILPGMIYGEFAEYAALVGGAKHFFMSEQFNSQNVQSR